MTDRNLNKYMAKAVSGMFFLDEPDRKFDLSFVRNTAEKLQKMPDFRAAMRSYGPEAVRQALREGSMQTIANMINGGPNRYAVSQQTRNKLHQLAETMQSQGRDKEWTALKNALSDPNMKDSRAVFNAVEGFVKGKKAVTRNPQRQLAVKQALDALAIVAENGDRVATARAQILADRFNEVRRTRPGDRNHVDLANYGKAPGQNEAEPVNEGPQHGMG